MRESDAPRVGVSGLFRRSETSVTTMPPFLRRRSRASVSRPTIQDRSTSCTTSIFVSCNQSSGRLRVVSADLIGGGSRGNHAGTARHNLNRPASGPRTAMNQHRLSAGFFQRRPTPATPLTLFQRNRRFFDETQRLRFDRRFAFVRDAIFGPATAPEQIRVN